MTQNAAPNLSPAGEFDATGIDLGLDKAEFRRRVENLSNLPTLPHLMDTMSQMIADPNSSMSDIGDEIAKDQVLTSKILRLVNSAFYGFNRPISTVTHALILLGYDAVKGLIVSTSVFEYLPEAAYSLWRHSLGVSQACRAVTRVVDAPDEEEMAVAGLLHDLGKVVMHIEASQPYAKLIEIAAAHQTPLWKMERALVGFDHAEIGLWLCEEWALPEKLAVPIGYHHKAQIARQHRRRVSIVAVADALVRAMEGGAEADLPLEELPPCVEEDVPLTEMQLRRLIDAIEPEIAALRYLTPDDMG
ncbi:MAG: HDOD domain-containing protein [Deltaproteobacteria bacterium]|nr:HDOD domain-containing protein [Deltaproteobacteria bacterium]